MEYLLGMMSHGDIGADPYERSNRAEKHLEDAVELGLPCHFELGMSYERRGKMDEASPWCSFLSEHGNNPGVDRTFISLMWDRTNISIYT